MQIMITQYNMMQLRKMWYSRVSNQFILETTESNFD